MSEHQGIPVEAWHFTPGGIAVRLFITCWLIYALHFATNIVREIYPALSIGDHLSFRVDEYANLHPDLFEKENFGWHINNNPGASMMAAIPYALARPAIDRVVERTRQQRLSRGVTEPPSYNSPWPMARAFFRESWLRGYDIKFGLAALVIQLLLMAPFSAISVVVMFFTLRQLFSSDKTAVWLALLYAFGTPVFFRTGFLNQNLLLAHVSFIGLIVMWAPRTTGDEARARSSRLTSQARWFLGGIAGGAALLIDYSGMVILLGFLTYGFIKRLRTLSITDAVRHSAWYVLGTLGPILLLWFYQWQSFGNPFLPAQHWMAKVNWIDQGYQGFSLPQADLLASLLIDYRYGLFASCPLFLLALFAGIRWVRSRNNLGGTEFWTLALLSIALWLFFACVNYSRLQFNTGVRYLAPAFPLLFILVATVLMRLPRRLAYVFAVIAIVQSWCMAMYRDVERGWGVLEPILRVFVGGLQLPALTTLSNLGDQYGGLTSHGVSALPLFALTAAILFGVWSKRFGHVNHRIVSRYGNEAAVRSQAPIVAD